jgi:transposase-like protein
VFPALTAARAVRQEGCGQRLTGVDQMVVSLYAKGLTTGEISAHFAEFYGASVSKETISRITDKVIEEMKDSHAAQSASVRWERSLKVRHGRLQMRQVDGSSPC